MYTMIILSQNTRWGALFVPFIQCTLFFKTRGHLLLVWVLPRLVLSCPVLLCLGLCVCLGLGNLQHTFFSKMSISISHFAHIWYSLRAFCKSITTSFANSHKHLWEWFIVGHTRQSKKRQDKARRRVASTRQDKKGVTWFLKIALHISLGKLVY